MSVEHASKRIIDGYARGDTDIAADEVWALEAHLEKCRNCRDGCRPPSRRPRPP